MYRNPCWGHVALFAGILLVLVTIGRTKFLADPDTFWHIIVGRQILQTGEFVKLDPFTFTFSGQPWIAHQWLGECTLAVIDHATGFDGLVLFASVLLAVLYAWAGGRLIQNGLNWLMAVLIISLAMSASTYSFLVRPHLCTMVLLGVTFGVLCEFEQGRITTNKMWWLVPLFVFWSNVHGGALGGLATFALCIAGWTVMFWLGKNSPIRQARDLVHLLLLIVICIAGTLVNPYGLDTPKTWRQIMQSDLPNLIIEHAPLDPTSLEGIMVLGFGLVYMTFLLGTLPNIPRITWLIPVVWLYLSWTRIRHGPLFAIVTTIALADLLAHSRCTMLLRKRRFFIDRDQTSPTRSPWPVVTVILIVVLLFTAAAYRKWNLDASTSISGFTRPDPLIWPNELLPDLRALEAKSESATVPIFNEQKFGGFLIYNCPSLRVFIDGRCELFGDDFMYRYDEARKRNPERIDEWSEQYGFKFALTITNSKFDKYLASASDWETIRRTPAATLHKRTGPNSME